MADFPRLWTDLCTPMGAVEDPRREIWETALCRSLASLCWDVRASWSAFELRLVEPSHTFLGGTEGEFCVSTDASFQFDSIQSYRFVILGLKLIGSVAFGFVRTGVRDVHHDGWCTRLWRPLASNIIAKKTTTFELFQTLSVALSLSSSESPLSTLKASSSSEDPATISSLNVARCMPKEAQVGHSCLDPVAMNLALLIQHSP